MDGHADQTLERRGIAAQFIGRRGMHHRATFQHQRAVRIAQRFLHLLLDEPMAGVPQAEGARLLAALTALPGDLAVLIIEHDMDLVFRFASRIVVLAEGAVLADGTPDQIRRDPLVRAAYLGT